VERVLVSACLLGERVRYSGGAATCDDPILRRWLDEGRIVGFCPEVAGGLGTPRPAAELQGLQKVVTVAGDDVTAQFLHGAAVAVEAVRLHRIRIAILKDGSPSCGSSYVYDGTFTATRVRGAGMTTRELAREGVRVFSECELARAAEYLAELESGS
jgi:uncharacterized protein YbbK (DUF523 family)